MPSGRDPAGDLVLQPYHSILQTGTYADWFPQARRFVYVNPTATDPLRRPDVPAGFACSTTPRTVGAPRLRLPMALDWTVADSASRSPLARRGRHLRRRPRPPAGNPGWARAGRRLRPPRQREPTETAIFVNRASRSSTPLGPVEAVLVEDAAGELASPAAAIWLQHVVVPALSRAAPAARRIDRLDYGAGAAVPDRTVSEIEATVDSLTTSTARLPHPCLDQWSWWRDATNHCPTSSNRDGGRARTTGDRTVMDLKNSWPKMSSRATRRGAAGRVGSCPLAADGGERGVTTYQDVDVVIVCESTYPYLKGGLSAVVHQICDGSPHLSIGIVHLTWDDGQPGHAPLRRAVETSLVMPIYQSMAEHRHDFQAYTVDDLAMTGRQQAALVDRFFAAVHAHLGGDDGHYPRHHGGATIVAATRGGAVR